MGKDTRHEAKNKPRPVCIISSQRIAFRLSTPTFERETLGKVAEVPEQPFHGDPGSGNRRPRRAGWGPVPSQHRHPQPTRTPATSSRAPASLGLGLRQPTHGRTPSPHGPWQTSEPLRYWRTVDHPDLRHLQFSLLAAPSRAQCAPG